ncbi:MAG: hypothetical protein CM15mV87_320 [Caudoviricetes sp.]|nr:MAG: hypothetical protein CM15mV87_320 [Caudoviricetes sp.]
MPYIGKGPKTGIFVYADDITTSATNTYNILVGGVAFSPSQQSSYCKFEWCNTKNKNIFFCKWESDNFYTIIRNFIFF